MITIPYNATPSFTYEILQPIDSPNNFMDVSVGCFMYIKGGINYV